MSWSRSSAAITSATSPASILTNGRHWRLYYQNALSVAEDFFEIDLGKVFGLPGCEPDLLDEPIAPEHAFRLFVLIFRRDAFLPSEHGRSFHLIAIEEARRWEEKVRRDLADTVFDTVFPELITAIPLADPARPSTLDENYAEEVRQAAMFLLYRLLFVLYAEDRNLLPDERGPYADYCLTRLRQEIKERHVQGQAQLARSTAYWSRLETIFGAISEGDDDLGIPPYNGGLFAAEGNPLLDRIKLSDDTLAKVILPLSHRAEDGRLRYINYRDLSVQQLGSIYESILEYGVEVDGSGSVRPRSDNEARHRSGSYYTPEPLVSLIIEKTVGPLVEERRQAFTAAVERGEKEFELAAFDPAMALLALRVVDPAMGSGHFLVSLVDWLSDKVLTAIGEAESLVDGYASPLVARIAELREGIVANAREHGWPIVEEQLDDRHIVRRMVLIPRDDVPREGLSAAVQAATYRAERADLGEEAWVLEPPDVAALLRKIKERGVPLVDYAGVSPLYGIKTGFNEAFLIDTPTRDRLVSEDPAAGEIIKPYLRGQDIGRWLPEWAGLWMIVMKSSGDHAWPWANAASEVEAEAIFAHSYPSLHRRFKDLESFKKDGKDKGLRHREDQGRFWWELRPCAYYTDFEKPKTIYQVIQYYPQYALDNSAALSNDKTFFLPFHDPLVIGTLNAPLMWWFNWRHLPHMKDEALSPMAYRMEKVPMVRPIASDQSEFADAANGSIERTRQIREADLLLSDWLQTELNLTSILTILRESSKLDSDGFVAAVRATLPKRQGLTPTLLRQLRDAFAETAEPARTARIELLGHERKLAAMVERAYGLTEEEVALMWRTAPPRMPLSPPR